MALRNLFPFLGIVITYSVAGQVSSDKPIQLNGAGAGERQVIGLANSTEAEAVLTAGVEQDGSYRTAQASGTSLWTVELPSLVSAIAAGTHLLVLSPSNATGDVSLNVNGQGPFAVLNGSGELLQATGLAAGTPLSIVFDGTAFQVLNGNAYARKPCTNGTVAVNDQFCIEPTERAGTDFFSAVTACGNSGLRLCSWSEHMIACVKASDLGLTGLTGNWEWIDDAVNENGSARVSGSTTCGAAASSVVGGTQAVRCCQTR